MLRLSSDQQVQASFTFLDRKGNKTTAENVRLESSDSDVAAVIENADGSFTIVAGQTGVAQLNFSADAKIGEGEKIITGSEVIEVVAGEAAVLKVSLGVPVDQPIDVTPVVPVIPSDPTPAEPTEPTIPDGPTTPDIPAPEVPPTEPWAPTTPTE